MGNQTFAFGRNALAKLEKASLYFWMGTVESQSRPIPNCWDELLDWTEEATKILRHYLRIRMEASEAAEDTNTETELLFFPYVLKSEGGRVCMLASMEYLERAEFLAENVLIAVLRPGQPPGLLTVGHFSNLHALLLRYLELIIVVKSRIPGHGQDVCAICLESKSTMVVLSCCHCLCSKCCERWVSRRLNCPYCRREFKRKTLGESKWEMLEYNVKDVGKDIWRLESKLEKFLTALDFASTSSELLTSYEMKERTMNVQERGELLIVN